MQDNAKNDPILEKILKRRRGGLNFAAADAKKPAGAGLESGQFSREVISNANEGIIVYDRNLNYVIWNRFMEKLTGLPAEKVLGRNAFQLFPHLREQGVDLLLKRALGGQIAKSRCVPFYVEETGKSGWVMGTYGPHRNADGEIIGVIGIVTDVTENKKTEKALCHRLAIERLIAKISTRFVNLKSEELNEAINNALADIGKFVGADRAYVFQLRDNGTKADNTHEWCAEGVVPQIENSKGIAFESQLPWFTKKMRAHKVFYVSRVDDLPAAAAAEKRFFKAQDIKSLVIVPTAYKGEFTGAVGFDSVREEMEWPQTVIALLKIVGEVFTDAIERTKAERERDRLNKELLKANRKLKRLALKDAHTGLYNHYYLTEIIEAEFHRAQRYANPLSVILLDIDYFKSINDAYGHQFGDMVLKQFALQLKKFVRRYDTVVRFDGEEFVIISPGIDRPKVIAMANGLLNALSLHNFGNNKNRVKLKLSIAVASFPEDMALNGMGLINLAEKILNKVKECGGNRVYTFLDIKNGKGNGVDLGHDAGNFKRVKARIEKLTRQGHQNVVEAIFAFAKTLEVKDHYTGEHVEQTVGYATQIAKMLNFSSEETEHIRQAAALHDLGKIGISEKILRKPCKLTPAEYKHIKKHPQIGVDIIRPIKFMHDIIPLVLYHHERWDGKGYPLGLKWEEIPVGARIISIADVYQALISDRPYRRRYPKEKAIKIIKEGAYTQFDPHIVDVFLNILKHEK